MQLNRIGSPHGAHTYLATMECKKMSSFIFELILITNASELVWSGDEEKSDDKYSQ